MDFTPVPSRVGAARRSRRLQGTPAGHTGSATTASGSPYARPSLKRDSSSQTLAALESGDSAGGSAQDADKLDRRKTVGGTDGLLGRVRRGLGWLVGRTADPTVNGELAEDVGINGQKSDEESMLTGATTRTRTQALTAGTPRTSSNLVRNAPVSANKRDYRPTPSVLSGDFDVSESAKKLRTSHSTLNLPRKASPPKATGQPHSSTSAIPSRALSPNRPLSPRLGLPDSQSTIAGQSKAHIFPSGPFGIPTHNTINGNSSRRSVSPGGLSQYALVSQPTSGTSSAFGLQSQSPFRAGGHSARSPDLAALNISSGLARSPSPPAERLLGLQRQGPRLYPYQRSPSILSGVARPGRLPASQTVSSGLAGSKRDYGAMSMSPPKASPLPLAFHRATPNGIRGSPTGTDFGSDISHRNKRQRVSVAWHPEKGFVPADADGNPLPIDEPPPQIPKNEAERILERLENIRRPQIDGLRSSSPRRLNVPLPSNATGSGSIFATRISTSQTEPTLSHYAISPVARQSQAKREVRAARRDIINSRGGLGEHLRVASMEQNHHDAERMTEDASEDVETVQSDTEAASNMDEQEAAPSPKSNRRRTRQRTRELSVMSDVSAPQEDTMTSLRRSTRIRKKPVAEETRPTVKERKGAKSPPPTDRQRTSAKGKKEYDDELVHDEDMDQDGASRPASPRRARSPPAKGTSRAASPTARQAISIDQVMSPQKDSGEPKDPKPTSPKLSAREQRLNSLQGRRTRGFSARDDEDDDLITVTVSTPQQPKLKLPNSVFANRFSFGRSPSSSLLAPTLSANPADKVQPSSAHVAVATATDASVPLPKLVLPSSARPASQPVTNAPITNAPITDTASKTSDEKATAASSPAPFSFGNAGKSTSTAALPAVQTKPLFSFNAPASDSPATSESKATEVSQTKPKPTFTFGAASTPAAAAKSDSQSEIAATTPTFTFGSASAKPKVDQPAPSFSFSKGSASPASESTPVIDVSKSSNPFAAFPPAPSGSAASVTKPQPFTFGQSSQTDSLASTASPAASAPAAPTFKFGAAPNSDTSDSKPSDAAGMQASPPPAAPAAEAAPKPLFSPVAQPSKAPAFSFGQPTNGSSSASPAIAATQAPAFSFGTQAAGQEGTKSRSASPFTVGAPAQPFSFGNNSTDTSKTSAPAFSFGAPKSDAKEGERPASSGFTFGAATPAASSTPAPAFSFAAAKPASTNPFAASSSMQPSGSAFGSSTPAISPGPQAAPAFGQANTNGAGGTPSFTFGSQANGTASTASTPAFSFGSSSAAPAATSTPAFSFGASNATGSAQPFVFGGGAAASANPAAATSAPAFNFSAGGGSQVGSPAGTPTGAGPAGGSFFTMGAGDPTSPNKARRPVKPLRRPR